MNLIRFNRPTDWEWDWAPPQLTTLQQEINRLFETPFAELRPADFFNAWTPAVDVYEDTDHLVVRAELPGLKKDQIDVWFEDGVLNIAGERKQETEQRTLHRTERFHGRFHRSFTLPKPVNADKISAAYQDGILTVTLPKTEAAKPKQIEVNVSGD
ncbi:MAG: Hsp20/alpha crystallin family protein [Verrucomicrobiota bacterium]